MQKGDFVVTNPPAPGMPRTLPPTTQLRAAELARLHDAWEEVARGRRRVALVRGEAGMGKSTLLDCFADQIAGRGGYALRARGSPGTLVPYAPFGTLLDQAGGLMSSDEVARFRPATWISGELRRRLDTEPTPLGSGDELAGAILGILDLLSSRAPTLVVIDDAEHLDRSSGLVLDQILGSAVRQLMIVVAYSDTHLSKAHFLSPLLDYLAAEPGTTRVALREVPLGVVGDLIEDPDLAAHIWQHADGNPLVITELAREHFAALAAGARQVSEPEAGPGPRPRPRSRRGSEPGSRSSPARSYDEAVTRRLLSLGALTRRFLEVAAMIGLEFDLDEVASADMLPPHRVSALAAKAEAAGFVIRTAESPGSPRGSGCRFVHELTVEVVLRHTSPHTAVTIHRELARTLGRQEPRGLDPGRPLPGWSREDHVWARLAYHAAQAAPLGGSAWASRLQAEAGYRCLELMAPYEAAEYFGHALALLPARNPFSPGSRLRLLARLAEAHAGTGDEARARAARVEILRCQPEPTPEPVTSPTAPITAEPTPEPVTSPTAPITAEPGAPTPSV